jgi:membrane-bound metal-dependent hydrolase YbcI (DUF457 family)
MPLPLGHTAAGLALHDLFFNANGNGGFWKTLGCVLVLTDLPDIDVVLGLIVHGNGHIFHRGPTHSLLFALVMGLLACNAWRCWSKIPKLSFLLCFLLILSHVVADAMLTAYPVSFWWPFELHLSVGHSGWTEVVKSVLFGAFRDLGIIFTSGALIFLNRLIRNLPLPIFVSRFVRGR